MLLGFVNFVMPKGTALHKAIGITWVITMLITAFTSFLIQSEDAYSWIHALSIVTIINVTLGFIAIRKGNKKMHIGCIVGAYFGSVVAGLFAAYLPGRLVYEYISSI